MQTGGPLEVRRHEDAQERVVHPGREEQHGSGRGGVDGVELIGSGVAHAVDVGAEVHDARHGHQGEGGAAEPEPSLSPRVVAEDAHHVSRPSAARPATGPRATSQ